MYQLQPTASSLICLMWLSLAHPWLALSFALSVCWSFLFPKHPTGFLLEHRHSGEGACCSWVPEVAGAAAVCAHSFVRHAGRLRGQHGPRALYLLSIGFGAAAGLSETFAVPYGTPFFLFWNMWSSLTATDFPKQHLKSQLWTCKFFGIVLMFYSGV